MKVKTVIVKVFVPLAVAIIGCIGSYYAGQNSEKAEVINTQKTEIVVKIDNLLGTEMANSVSSDIVEVSVDNLANAYSTIKNDLDVKTNDYNELNAKFVELQTELETLQESNEELLKENEKLKDFLLMDNTYADSVDDLVKVVRTYDRLTNLYVIDGQAYDVEEGFTDLLGNPHGESYRFRTDGSSWIKFKLDGKYDIFTANIATTSSVNRDTKLMIEIYLDDNQQPVKTISDITRDTGLMELGDVVVTNAKTMKVNVVTLEGSNWYGWCYLTDDTLSVVK